MTTITRRDALGTVAAGASGLLAAAATAEAARAAGEAEAAPQARTDALPSFRFALGEPYALLRREVG